MIQIRDARIDDVDGIAKVHVQTWRSAYAGVLPDDYLVDLSEVRHALLWRSWLNSRRADHHVFVAVGTGEGVVGFASCGRLRDGNQLGGEDRAGEIYTLYVLPDYQGQGFGRDLLVRCFAELSADACDSAVLWVLEANPSRFFYEAMGGRRLSGRQEKFAGAMVGELAYGWDSLVVNQDR